MAKNKALNAIISGAAIIGGAWILSEIIKGLSNPVYKCPNCRNTVNTNMNICPYCRIELRW